MAPGRLIKRVAKVLGWSVLLLVVLVLALLVTGPTVSFDFLVAPLQETLTRTVGYPVELSGVQCKVGLHPTLFVEKFRVGDAGATGSNLVAVTSLRFTTSLPALLAETIRIENASIREMEIHVPETPAPDPDSGAGSPSEVSSTSAFPILDVVGVRIDRMLMVFPAGEHEERVELSGVDAVAPLGGSSRLAFQAAWREQQADVDVVGGNLNSLLRGPLLWPVQVEAATVAGTLEVNALVQGSPFPEDAQFDAMVIVRDVRLDRVPHETMMLEAGRVVSRIHWKGLNAADILASIDVQSLADDVRLVEKEEPPDGKKLEVLLRHGLASWRPGRPIAFNGDGELLGEPVHLDADVGPITAWPPRDGLPFDARAEGAGAMLHVVGEWGGEEDLPQLQVQADLQGDRIGDLAPWIGFSPDAALPYRVTAVYEFDHDGVRVELKQARVGSTRAHGQATRRSDKEGRTSREVDLAFDVLDLEELAQLSGSGRAIRVEEAASEAAEARRLRLDIPVLPSNMRLPDAELDLSIVELRAQGGGMENVQTRLRFRDGWLERSPFSLSGAGAQWTGECFLDARKAVPVLGVELLADDVAVDELLPVLSEDPDLSIRAGRVFLEAKVEGATMRQMLKRNTISLKAEEVHILLPRRGETDPADIAITMLSISRPELEKDLYVEADLAVGGRAARIRSRLDLYGGSSTSGLPQLRFDGTLTSSTTEVAVAGTMKLPLRDIDLDLEVSLKTENPAWLTDLIGLGWKPIAPFEVTGRVTGRQGAYEIGDLHATLNRSRLAGGATYDSTGDALTWRVEGHCPELWLEDLGMVEDANEVETVEGEELEDVREEPPDGKRRVEGEVALRVDQAYFDGKTLGGGAFGLRMEPGRMVLQPVRFRNEELYGDMYFGTEVLAGGDTSRWAVAATATNLPINLLSLVAAKFAASKGAMYADVDVASLMPEDDPRFMAHLNGELGFAVFPENIRSRFLDYWAVGAIQALGMTLTGQGESQVECIAGRLILHDGMARPRHMYIDTSRMRVNCSGWINFNTGKLHLKMRPRPKGMAFISLATPVEVKGTLSDPDIDVTKKALAGTVLRVYFWFVTAIDSLFRKNIPEHDHEGYMRMMSGEKP